MLLFLANKNSFSFKRKNNTYDLMLSTQTHYQTKIEY